MKTAGRLFRQNGGWILEAEPHVMIKAKAVLPKINKTEFGKVALHHTKETARDLAWFMQRYPLEMAADHRSFLNAEAEAYDRTLAELEAIALPGTLPQISGLAHPLREYQTRAVHLYWKRGSLLVADQLGLGKSITAIGSLMGKGTAPALIVCQTHLQNQWRDYIAKFLPQAKVHIIKRGTIYDLPASHVFIITYHKLAGWADVLRDFIKSIVFDEVQELRHADTSKYRAATAIRNAASYCMGLSATPIYNYGGEIFNVMEIIAPNSLGSPAEFFREWCHTKGQHILLNDPVAFGAWLRSEYLMVRRTREEVGRELPPYETIIETIEYKQEALDQIDEVATELAHRILKGTFIERGEAARQFDIRLRQATGIAKAPYVAAFVKMLVEDGHNCVLTGWHREVYDIWRLHLEAAGIESVLYTGTESPNQKEQAKEKFLKGEAKVFMLSLRSGAGLDGLQNVCNTIVHGELDWSPQVHDQCRGRLFRDGQNSCVQEFYLLADGGSDPIVADVLGIKTSQSNGLLEGRSGGIEQVQGEIANRVKHMATRFLERKRT